MLRMRRKKNPARARQRRVRAKILGTADRPRFSVFRSNRYLVAQLIDDVSGRTLAYASDREMKSAAKKALPKRNERATRVGEAIAKKAETKGIRHVTFDRGSYRYHGLVRSLAEGARRGGLKF